MSSEVQLEKAFVVVPNVPAGAFHNLSAGRVPVGLPDTSEVRWNIYPILMLVFVQESGQILPSVESGISSRAIQFLKVSERFVTPLGIKPSGKLVSPEQPLKVLERSVTPLGIKPSGKPVSPEQSRKVYERLFTPLGIKSPGKLVSPEQP